MPGTRDGSRCLRRAAAAFGWCLPQAARAHGTVLDWHAPPASSLWVLLPVLALATLYLAGAVRLAAGPGMHPRDTARSVAFSCGLLLLGAALVWPLDAWAGLSFAAHMLQHVFLTTLAPILLLLGRLETVCLRGLPQCVRRAVTRPRRWPGAPAVRRLAASLGAVTALHAAVIWGWHLPAAFEAALRSDAIHWAEHVTLLASGILFWRVVLRARGDRVPGAALALLVTVIHCGMLGSLLALAPQPLFGTYVRLLGPRVALDDQQLAGLIMWVPMGSIYLLAALVLAARALGTLTHPQAGPPAR